MIILNKSFLSKNKLIKETGWSFASKGSGFILYFILYIYLARVLGVDKYGEWSLFFSMLTIILLISYLGINASANKYVAQWNGTEKLHDVLVSSFTLRFAFSLLFSIIVFIFHNKIAMLFGRPDFSSLFLLSSPFIFFTGMLEYLKSVSLGLHRVKYNFIFTFFEYTLKLVFTYLFLKEENLYSIVNAFTLSTFIVFVIGLYLIYKNFYSGAKPNDCCLKISTIKEIHKYSIPLFFISIGFLVATEIDTLMLGSLATNYDVGTYAVAKQIINKLPHLALIISMGTMPVFAKFNEENKEELLSLFNKVLKTNLLLFFFIVIIIISTAHLFIPLIYGNNYIGAILPLQILTIYLLSSIYSTFVARFLDYQGLAKKRGFYLMFAVILNIVLNYVLIPFYGAAGAAAATSISYLPYNLLSYWELNKHVTNIGSYTTLTKNTEELS